MTALLESIDVQTLNLILVKSVIIQFAKISVSLILLGLRYSTLGPSNNRDAHGPAWMSLHSFPASSSFLHGLTDHTRSNDGYQGQLF